MVDKIDSRKGVFCLADCSGLIGFEITMEDSGYAKMRADNNRHKHCILFKVELSIPQRREVRALLNEGDPVEALMYIKRAVTKWGHPKGSENYRKSWDKIPNPALDIFAK